MSLMKSAESEWMELDEKKMNVEIKRVNFSRNFCAYELRMCTFILERFSNCRERHF